MRHCHYSDDENYDRTFHGELGRMKDSKKTTISGCQLLTVKDVAAMLRVHTRTVWRMSASGDIPAPKKLGPRTVRWRMSDLAEYIASPIDRNDQHTVAD
jgi:excisionase family DNA binding protein